MKNSQAKEFEKALAKLRQLHRKSDVKGLTRFMGSPEYIQMLRQASPEAGIEILSLIGDTWRSATDKAAGDPKAPIPKYSLRGWRSWDEGRVARLKALWARYGDDKAVARGLGISLEAAKRARRRHIGKAAEVRPTTDFALAA